MTRLTLNQFRIMNVAVWLGYLIVVTNFLTPERTSHPTVKAAVASMAEWIPMLDSIQAIPGVNDWIRCIYAGVWLLAPFYIASGWYQLRCKFIEQKERAGTASDWVLILSFLFAYPLGGWMMYYWPIPDINGWRDHSVASGIAGISHTVFIMCVIFWLWGAFARMIYTRIHFGYVNEHLAKIGKN